MPIFEYKCTKCEHTMEFLEKAGGKGRHICERCGSSAMQKLFSSFAVGRSGPAAPCDSCPSSLGPGQSCQADTCQLT